MRLRTARFMGVAAIAMAVALVASACGDDSSSGGGESGSSAPAPAGPAIDLGYINIENSPAGSFPDYRQGAEAAVEYINAEQNGVNGRPLALEPCVTNGTQEGSIACANKFVQGKKTAVIASLDYGADGSVPILEKAAIPYIAGLPVQTAELMNPDAFSFVGASPGAVSALSRYIGEDLKAKKVSILYFDVPAATLAINTFAKPILEKLGTTDINLVAESATAADYTSAVTKAGQGDPDAILVLFAGQACSKIMEATASLGIDSSKMVYVQTCGSDSQLKAGGGGAANATFNSPYLTVDSDDAEVKVYKDAMEEYASDAPLGPGSQTGFNTVMNVYNQLKTLDPNAITPAALTQALKAAKDAPSFMAHPYTCDGQQVPGLTAVCNANERIVKYENGNFSDVTGDWVDGVSLLTP